LEPSNTKASRVSPVASTQIEFELNGVLMQQASAAQMAFGVDELIS